MLHQMRPTVMPYWEAEAFCIVRLFAVHGGKDLRVDAEDRAREHPYYVGARGEESGPVVLSEVEENYADKSGYGDEREDETEGPRTEAPPHPRAHPEGSRRGDHG